LAAPALIHAEVGNALWKRVRKNELLDDGELEDRLADLARYIRTIDEIPLMNRALRLAIDLRHPIYDCVYLALAEASASQLLTADRRFIRATAATPYAALVKELGA
jgi:predicted nucleic acid-binding protein